MSPDAPTQPGRPVRGATQFLRDIFRELDAAQSAGFSAGTAAVDEDDDAGPKATLGDIVDRLDERAFGLLLLLLALPCTLPFVYLLPQLVALPMLALAGQMAAGRKHPWLPARLHERSFSLRSFQKVLDRSEKYVGWVERFARPRLSFITGHHGSRLAGALLMIPTASILVPLPGTNTIPGIGVAIASLGVIERDGVLVIIGLVVGFAWVALLATLGLEAASLIKDWLTAQV